MSKYKIERYEANNTHLLVKKNKMLACVQVITFPK